MSEQYPLSNLEAVAELCKDPTRIVENESGAKYNIRDGELFCENHICWPTKHFRYRVLPLPQPKPLEPVELADEVGRKIDSWAGAFNGIEISALKSILGLAIAQAIRDARGEK